MRWLKQKSLRSSIGKNMHASYKNGNEKGQNGGRKDSIYKGQKYYNYMK